MPASGSTHGLLTEFHKIAVQSGTISATTLATAVSATTQIEDVNGITPPTITRSTTAKQSFTTQTDVPVPLRRTLGEMSFTFVYDPSEAMHTALRDDDLSTTSGWVLVLTDPAVAANKTYHYFTGFVTSKGTSAIGEDFIEYGVTVAMTSEPQEYDVP